MDNDDIEMIDVTNSMKTTEIDEHGKMQWIQHEDDAGTPYYENKKSGRTTWTPRDSSGQMLKGASDVAEYTGNPMKNHRNR